ncbi:MAG: glycosyltransferase family A protein [Bacteroidota bacterium]
MGEKINILIRTCKRPNYFKNCIGSIVFQNYDNINIVIGIESGDNETLSYVAEVLSHVENLTSKIVFYEKQTIEIPAPPDTDKLSYGKWFPYNKYLDILGDSIKDGWVIYIDDDDRLITNESLMKIASNIKSESDLIFWRVNFINRLVPEVEYWKHLITGGVPICYHIAGGGFCFNSKYLKKINWGYWTLGDYRVVTELFSLCDKKKFINEPLTGIQNTPGLGLRNDL